MSGWPPPQPPGSGPPRWDWPPAAAPTRTDGVAIAATVLGACSLLLFFVVLPALAALVLAALAWRRIGKAGGRVRGRGLAGIGAALGAASLAGGVLFIGAVVDSHLFEGHLTKYTSLHVGDCFSTPAGLAKTLTLFQVVPCTDAHTREVVGLVTDPTGGNARYPGATALIQEGQHLCPAQVRSFVGAPVDSVRFAWSFYYPRQVNWDNGVRTIICVVHTLGGAKATGSVRRGAST